MNLRVAVLLATYNGIRWIGEQVDSILSQTDVQIDLYVGDDCSSDGTLTALQKLYREDDRVIFLDGSSKRYGSPTANFLRILFSVELKNYDYIFFADQDDYWHPSKIISAINAMQSARADCYAADLACVYSDGRKKILRKSFRQTENDFMFQGASAGCTYGLSRRAASLCRDVLSEVDDELQKVISHDWAIYAVTRSNLYVWVLDSEIYIDYRQHATNAYGALGLKSYAKRFLLLKNGWYRNNIKALSRLCALNEEQLKIIAALDGWGFRDRFFLLSKSWSFRRRPVEKMYLMLLIFFKMI